MVRYMIQQAKQLVREEEILSSPNPEPGKILCPDVAELVKNPHSLDELSRLVPGKKDCTCVNEDEVKKPVQKRLILANLKEIYGFLRRLIRG